ncbi:hypothetical protein KY290_010768 [Solanum tuberosum]|uniref:Gag-pol polyprotein n=1 Tax=Solanum tuberosum TaxID=4113 RepID=A0ABQ7VYR5_SOLTU|nr:hypothetical protein KY290_010768 [Solanum tuberosum]
MKSIEQRMKSMQGLGRHKSVAFKELCMFPNVHLPPGFKTPKFDKYDGHDDPIAHLKRYYNQLRGAGVKEELLMEFWKIRVIESIPPHRLYPTAPGFQANERCEYHSGAPRHNTDNYWTLKRVIEKLIYHGVVVITDDQNNPNVTNNPLPAQNNLVGMISDDQEYKLLGKMGKSFRKIGEDMSLKSSEPVTSLSVEGVNLDSKVLCVPEVLKGIKVRAGMLKLYVSKGFSLTQWDQSCLAKLKEPIFVKSVQQLSVTDSKVVPWNYNKIVVVYRGKEIVEEVDEAGRLTRSERSHVSKETTVNQLEKIAKRIFKSNTITFTDDELPTEGAGYNRVLLLTVKCEGYYVKRVMINGGSGVDICPLSILQSLKINPDIIRPSNVFARAYDGSRRDTFGEIKLNMTIGPVDFMIVFQVMDMDTSYNFLLGRPWIQAIRYTTWLENVVLVSKRMERQEFVLTIGICTKLVQKTTFPCPISTF